MKTMVLRLALAFLVGAIAFDAIAVEKFGPQGQQKGQGKEAPPILMAACRQAAVGIATYTEQVSTAGIISNIKVTRSEVTMARSPNYKLEYRVTWQRETRPTPVDFEVSIDGVIDKSGGGEMPICHISVVRRISTP